MREEIKNGDARIDALAGESGIDVSVLSQMENDFTKINEANAITVFRLARVLGCKMEELMEV